MGARTVFVDGYNVIRATPALTTLFHRDIGAAREALLRQVVAQHRHTPHRVVVVFDGDGPSESHQPIAGFSRGQVTYSRAGETADNVIVRMSAAVCDAGGEALVVSNDFGVRDGAERQGARSARVAGPAGAPRLIRQRFTHQQAVRRELEQDGEDAEARAATRRKGNPRQSPRDRRRDH
ncbi:MAG TPA: NYN domain-containing protein [Ktedonobacterales bacterium]